MSSDKGVSDEVESTPTRIDKRTLISNVKIEGKSDIIISIKVELF